jgi:hypothetical protein
MPQYQLRSQADADRLELRAAGKSEEAKDANERADNYMLAVVLFACALFFAGVSMQLHVRNLRIGLLALGWIVFLGTAIWLATSPVQLTI